MGLDFEELYQERLNIKFYDKEFMICEHISRIQNLISWKETEEMVLIAARMPFGILDTVMGCIREAESRMTMEVCGKSNQKAPKIGHAV